MSTSRTETGDEFFESLLGDFLDESSQLLDRLNENLLRLDVWARALNEGQRASCDADLLNEMFRAAHSLKGLSAMLGLRDINELTHKVENVFDAARRSELYLACDSVEMLFRAVDCLVGLVAGLKTPAAPPVDTRDVVGQIARLLQEAGAERQASSQADAEGALTAGALLAAEVVNMASALPTIAPHPAPPSIDYFADIIDEQDVPAKYLSIFIDETELALDNLTETLLDIEGVEGEAARETLLVVSHRIKGSAAAVGLNRPAKLAHFMEDLLQQLREERGTLTPGLADAMLRCTDGLRSYLSGLKRGEPDATSFNQFALELLAARDVARSTANGETERSAPIQPLQPSVATLAEVAALAPGREAGLVGRIQFVPEFPLVGLKAQLIVQKLLHLGTLYYCDPASELLEEIEGMEVFTFGLFTEATPEAVAARLKIVGVRSVTVEQLPASADEEPTAATTDQREAPRDLGQQETPNNSGGNTGKAKPDANGSENRPTETLRVDIERLDQLMNLAGQLVINKARFSQIGEGLRGLSAGKQTKQLLTNLGQFLTRITGNVAGLDDPRAAQAELELLAAAARRMQSELEAARDEMQRFHHVRTSINELFESVHQLDRISDGIQKTVMDTRMVPIGPLFGRFRRVIRDLTRVNGKQIELDIRGEKTELDKRMIDELGDPLIHMVRNSADHGVESPNDRMSAGKPAQGTIVLDAFHRGNSIYIQVCDDGRGLNTERIRQKAIDRGLLPASDAERLTPHQVHQLIWEPGFSTAEKITEVSGRGMGMDIVKSKIEELNGTVDLESTPGHGTTFTIKLPLTLAILPSLMAEIDGDTFAMPLESVVEIVRVRQADQWTVHGRQAANVRGRVISVVWLSELLQWSTPAAVATTEDDLTLVILGAMGREVGLVVHRLLGEEDVVIKSLADNYANVTGIAGASILGDGRVSLILDVGTLIDMASRGAAPVAVN